MGRDHLMLLRTELPSPLRACLQAFLLDREAARCSAKTIIHYEGTAGRFVDFLEARGVRAVGGILPQHIRAYLVGLQARGMKDTTQHAHARGIKAWLNWLVAEGDLAESPMRRVSMPRLEKRVPEPFSREEMGCLLAACGQVGGKSHLQVGRPTCGRGTADGARDYAILLGLLDTGLRAAEFVGLRVGDVDMRTGLITVVGKGRKQRVVRLGARARGALLRYLAGRGDAAPGEPLWARAGDGRGLTVNGLQNVLRRLGVRAGVAPCSPHRFRRTFAVWCLRDGMDLASLRMLMGHADLTVLLRYLALAREDVERAHRDHSPVDRLLDR